MNASDYPDLNLNGMANASGGKYRSVTIEGVGKVDGDLMCETFKLNGMGTIRGNLVASRFEMKGRMTGEGSVTAKSVLIEGISNLNGCLLGDDIRLNGMINVNGDCEAERFAVEGGFAIDGLLNAGTIDIGLYGRGQAKEIGGELIRVKKLKKNRWSGLLKWIAPSWDNRLKAGTIEGDDIHLEHTTANVVRGNRIVIGPGCRIERVEYRTELLVQTGAKVNKQIKG
ncbi:hypothetical protein [Paenibacillus hamazuiensis]|uniref:hypothetical protein n=1 Tax=Paenibacillus hamazuiensis TaxID=2936508 RepID=UPI00200CE681|nr:hypothetical protein [Paenibacillus hamazuiensis]